MNTLAIAHWLMGVGEDQVVERHVFRLLGIGVPIFYAMAGLCMAVFAYGVWRQFSKYRRGKPASRLTPLLPRIMAAAQRIGSHTTIKRGDAYAGIAHGLVFWGFAVLFIGTSIVAFDEDGVQLIFGHGAKILVGNVYLVFSFLMDLFGLLFIIGLGLMMVRRQFFGLSKLSYARSDIATDQYDRASYKKGDALFTWLLMSIAVSGFLIEAARLASDAPEYERWSFVGWGIAKATGGLLASDQSFLVIWWGHVAVVFFFIAYIPFSKAMHIITNMLSLVSVDDRAGIELPKAPKEGPAGVTALEDLSWRQLLAYDACTKCGRCHDVCPARTTGAPLSPRDFILDMREYSSQQAGNTELFGTSRKGAEEEPLVGGYISADTLWACTTCRACVEQCPVGIEHVVDIVQMRRTLIDKGDMEESLQDALRGLDEKGNSFGESARKRAKWAKALDFKIKDATKDPVDLLWFVGDFASYNQACQSSTQNFARILHKAGVDFGILHKAEKSAGNDVRRVGEEGLFESLAQDNIATLEGCTFKRIVTTDPHTYNTLKNEYAKFGGEYEVVHHSEVLMELLGSGKLEITTPLSGKATYHDPCYLGRYNGIYDAPRKVIAKSGLSLLEMPRNKSNSFCCGAGGGRVWMSDYDSQTERPSENRIKEAMPLGVNTFVVACPRDMTMYADAVKTSGNEGKLEVRDIIDLVAQAAGLNNIEGEFADG